MKLEINETTPAIIILVAGSLLSGSQKNRVYLEYKSRYLGVVETPTEYSMYDLGNTCAIAPGKNSIIAEAYEITQDRVLQNILKYCCGTDLKLIKTKFGNAYLPYFPDYMGDKHNLIISGNWRNRKLIRKNYIHKSKHLVHA